MDLVRRWLDGWRLCRDVEPVIEDDDAYVAVLHLPGRERELFARTDDPATVERLPARQPAGCRLNSPTDDGDELAERLTAAGLRPFEEQKTLMSIDPLSHPKGTAELESDGPLEYARVRVDGVVAAHGMAAIVGDDAVIHDIQTEPAYRRRGLGTVVMGALAARAVERGARTGLLMATTDGFGLYRRLGWVPEATMVTASGSARPVGGDLGPVLTGR